MSCVLCFYNDVFYSRHGQDLTSSRILDIPAAFRMASCEAYLSLEDLKPNIPSEHSRHRLTAFHYQALFTPVIPAIESEV